MAMDLLKVEVNDFGGSPVCEHNYPCPVFYTSRKAVFVLGKGIFQPSWSAQELGYFLVKASSPFQRWIMRTFLEVP